MFRQTFWPFCTWVSVGWNHGFQSPLRAVACGYRHNLLMEEGIEKKNTFSTNFCKNKKKQQQVENIQKIHRCDKKWNDMFLFLIEGIIFLKKAAFEVTKMSSKMFWLVGFKYVIVSHSYSGKNDPIWLIFGKNPIWLAHIFQLGWLFNHQQTFCLLGLPGWCSPSVHHLRSIRCCTDWKTWKMSVRRLPKESW